MRIISMTTPTLPHPRQTHFNHIPVFSRFDKNTYWNTASLICWVSSWEQIRFDWNPFAWSYLKVPFLRTREKRLIARQASENNAKRPASTRKTPENQAIPATFFYKNLKSHLKMQCFNKIVFVKPRKNRDVIIKCVHMSESSFSQNTPLYSFYSRKKTKC